MWGKSPPTPRAATPLASGRRSPVLWTLYPSLVPKRTLTVTLTATLTLLLLLFEGCSFP